MIEASINDNLFIPRIVGKEGKRIVLRQPALKRPILAFRNNRQPANSLDK